MVGGKEESVSISCIAGAICFGIFVKGHSILLLRSSSLVCSKFGSFHARRNCWGNFLRLFLQFHSRFIRTKKGNKSVSSYHIVFVAHLDRATFFFVSNEPDCLAVSSRPDVPVLQHSRNLGVRLQELSRCPR